MIDSSGVTIRSRSWGSCSCCESETNAPTAATAATTPSARSAPKMSIAKRPMPLIRERWGRGSERGAERVRPGITGEVTAGSVPCDAQPCAERRHGGWVRLAFSTLVGGSALRGPPEIVPCRGFSNGALAGRELLAERSQCGEGIREADRSKRHLVAGPELREDGAVGRDGDGDDRVAAGGLVIREEHDRSPVRRELDRPDRHAVRRELDSPGVDREAVEPECHPVGARDPPGSVCECLERSAAREARMRAAEYPHLVRAARSNGGRPGERLREQRRQGRRESIAPAERPAAVSTDPGGNERRHGPENVVADEATRHRDVRARTGATCEAK